MGELGDRMDRAGRYVLGLMDDEERERAERDLEIDPAFRDAMVEIAERMHVFDRMPAPDQPAGQPPGQPPGKPPQDDWRLIKERLEAMPQMRPAAPEPMPSGPAPSGPQVTFGRRRSDRLHGAIVPEMPPGTIGRGLHSVPSRRALLLALCLIAAFVLGYVAGVTSVEAPPAIATAP
ncbi:hypothetical protein [Mesorhizobium sp. KR9-304]|uniref:hypothetical protein n=1 Tax=Mesorhizobium sp. KR9-304 TaxID=3156614 RepID=UPI0032B3C9D2